MMRFFREIGDFYCSTSSVAFLRRNMLYMKIVVDDMTSLEERPTLDVAQCPTFAACRYMKY